MLLNIQWVLSFLYLEIFTELPTYKHWVGWQFKSTLCDAGYYVDGMEISQEKLYVDIGALKG